MIDLDPLPLPWKMKTDLLTLSRSSLYHLTA
jgi:hypothetical protein